MQGGMADEKWCEHLKVSVEARNFPFISVGVNEAKVG
jgi:hypothetical protein